MEVINSINGDSEEEFNKRVEDKLKKDKLTKLYDDINNNANSWETLLGKFGNSTKEEPAITSLKVLKNNDNCDNISMNTSNDNIKICIEKNHDKPGLKKDNIKIDKSPPIDIIDKLIPLNYKFDSDLYLYTSE